MPSGEEVGTRIFLVVAVLAFSYLNNHKPKGPRAS